MNTVLTILQLLVVLGCIIMGTRSSGVALGIWGGVGVAILVFIFRLPPGDPPTAAILIVLGVVLAAAMMQLAGGIDWMVSVAARIIAKDPKRITLIAPLVSFFFALGAGTSNIMYPLLPVIQDLSYRNGIRPSRPLSLSVVATGVALGCSPVSAAMAMMIGFTAVAPYNFDLIHILRVTIPAAICGIIVSSFIVNRLGRNLIDDPLVLQRIESGEIAPPSDQSGPLEANVNATRTGRNAALIFLAGVLAIIVFGLFESLRRVGPEGTVISMNNLIPALMFVVAAVILLVCHPDVSLIPEQSVFRAGVVSAIALFGLAWLTTTFINAHSSGIANGIGSVVDRMPWVFALGVFIVCVLTTSQSTATNSIVPIGLAAGVPLGMLSGMWAGAFAGIYLLPTNGTQIASANFDTSGTTQLGTRLYDHSFFIPTLILAATTIAFGMLFGALFG